MLSFTRLTAGLLFVGMLTAGCLALQPEYFSGLGLDVGDVPDLLRRIQSEDGRQEALARKEERLRNSMAVKDATAKALSEGRLTLAEAVEQFRRVIGDAMPLVHGQLRYLHPEAPPEELLHLHVIDWTQECLERQPDRCFRVVGRLQQELRAARPSLKASARF